MAPVATTANPPSIDARHAHQPSPAEEVRRPPRAAHPRLRFARLVPALASCLVGWLAVGANAAVAHTPRSRDNRAGLATSIRWTSCGVRRDCARVQVPLDGRIQAARRSRSR